MLNVDDPRSLIGSDVYDTEGKKLGSAGQIFLDDQTNQPEWVTVNTGLFGTKETFVPLREASFTGDAITVPYDKSTVKGAPTIDSDGHLAPNEEQELYSYYGLGYDSTDSGITSSGTAGYDSAGYDAAQSRSIDGDRDFDSTRGDSVRSTVGHDTSGPNTDAAMTVSEERLNVGTERVETGRARLKKYVVTENQTVNVPVSREEVTLQREPITDGNVGDALDGPTFSEETHEVTLTEERPVVNKEAVPVERVRLDTQTVTDQETVTDSVQKEQVDLDWDRGTGNARL
jgi:uncharacterized protein (TIGR02271 family)